MSFPPPVLLELDPTHQRKLDVGVPGVEASAWLRPCNAQFYYWGTPCDCQEGDCEQCSLSLSS